jgi:hypothetical protein
MRGQGKDEGIGKAKMLQCDQDVIVSDDNHLSLCKSLIRDAIIS